MNQFHSNILSAMRLVFFVLAALTVIAVMSQAGITLQQLIKSLSGEDPGLFWRLLQENNFQIIQWIRDSR